MSISPMAVGATRPIMTAPLSRTDGSVPNLTGLNPSAFALNIYNVSTKASTTGAGSFYVLNASGGVVQYIWNSADTATVGTYQLNITITYAAGQIETFGPVPLIVYTK